MDSPAPRHPRDYGPRDPAFYADPFRAYAVAHASAPTFRWDAYGQLCFSAHADVSALLRDRRFGRQRWQGEPPPPRPDLVSFDALERHSMLELEPPEHTHLRRVVNRSFVSRQIASLEPFVRERARRLIAQFPPGEAFDLLPAFATPLPVEVIATALGVPTSDSDRLLAWSHAMVAIYAFGTDADVRRSADAAAREFDAYVRGQLVRARGSSDDTILRTLAMAPDVSDDQAVSTVILLLNAGHEATVHQIGNAVRHLIAARDGGLDLHAWITDDKRLEALVEECLRYAPPLHLFTRIANELVEWTDADGRTHRIERGEEIALLLGAANRDPRHFPDPNRFDPARERLDHVAFGGGIHFCLGAPLARLELRIAIGELFLAYPKLKLAEEPVVADTFHFHGLKRLMVSA